MSVHGVLGETTSYPKTYQPDTLYAIPRGVGREAIESALDNNIKLDIGVDWWHAFEVSWLNTKGVSQVAVARFTVPADSPNIVESKSLKLYLNSLNFTEFENWQMVQDTITKDLSSCVGAKVDVVLYNPDSVRFDKALSSDKALHLDKALNSDKARNSGFLIGEPQGICLDDALEGITDKIEIVEHPDSSLLNNSLPVSAVKDDLQTNNIGKSKTGSFKKESVKTDNCKIESLEPKSYQFYSNLLRSNCPVTNQPDWGTLAIEMTTAEPVSRENLIRYILSFRTHNGFHEQCVEQIFADISRNLKPSKLMVRAWYTRRGGIDINPCRVSDINLLPHPSRLIRQ